jgi:ribosome-associated protein
MTEEQTTQTDTQITNEHEATGRDTDPVVSVTKGDPEKIRSFAVECARTFKDDKCEHIVVLDVRGRSQVTDYVIVGSGTSDRQMNAAIDDAVELGASLGFSAARTNKDDRSTWLLADFVDVVAHLFEPNTRAYYDIEMLWGDAPRIEWRRDPDSKSDSKADTNTGN